MMRKSLLILVFFMLGISWAFAGSKEKDVREGNKLYRQGKYEESLDKYQAAQGKDANSPIINYGLGTLNYKNKKYKEAIDALEKSLLTDDPGLKQKAHYNLGNTLYQFGLTQENQDLPGAIDSLNKSLGNYKKAEAVHPDEDAKYNEEIVTKDLERLKKKQQEKQSDRNDSGQQGEGKQGQGQDQKDNDSSAEDQKQNKEEQDKDKGASELNKQNENGDNNDKIKNASQSQSENKEDQNNRSAQEQSATDQAVTVMPKEAQRMLDQYKESEEPQQLFNPLLKGRDMQEVDKDW